MNSNAISVSAPGAGRLDRGPGRRFVLALLGIVLVAFGLRVGGLSHDLWLDEVWTWGLARAHPEFLDLFRIESSNHHPLNTLWFQVVGDQDQAFVYRVPALLAGLATVVLGAYLERRFDPRAGLLAGILLGASFLLVAYSAEARGYALEVAAALAAFLATRAWLARPNAPSLLAAWGAILVGLLSQYLFVAVLAALGIWSAARVVGRPRGERAAELRRALAFHSVPAALVLCLWFGLVSRVQNAGAPPFDLSEMLGTTLSWSLGLPRGAAWTIAGIALVAAVVTLDAVQLARAGRDEWVFHAALIVLVPIGLTVALREEYVCPRYFLVSLAFFLVAAARVLTRLARRGRIGLALALGLTVVFVASNSLDTRAFVLGGRGGYRAVVETMGREDPADVISVSGNFEFNVWALLAYHQRCLPRGKSLRFDARDRLPPQGVEWLVLDEPRFETPPAPRLQAGPMTFELRGLWSYFGPSGAEWALYRRVRP